eukprot:CAMPEP_0174834928 /NCGR_PEP_ID=MMETSP1114-20130205/5127_1 /TAXON_ID=312471 /ORGANISM="Neobodo designis, Strain CCAP 1951/1" /LENGTH=106 /DNA_ID=CAMNT_0016068857 /DNA_START=765 /DNA_END=1082 /DNA_ORIENTATION=+
MFLRTDRPSFRGSLAFCGRRTFNIKLCAAVARSTSSRQEVAQLPERREDDGVREAEARDARRRQRLHDQSHRHRHDRAPQRPLVRLRVREPGRQEQAQQREEHVDG